MTWTMTRNAIIFGAMLVSQAGIAEERAWIHGSWVNVRSTSSATATVRKQLTTNTEVILLERRDDWCSIRVFKELEGFVLCSLIGSRPLTIQDASGSPARLFWIAPSVGRLILYGSELRTGAAYKRMYSKLESDQIARIQPLAEYDAAKRLMEAGVVPSVAAEIDRGSPVEVKQMMFSNLIPPRPITPSLFHAHGDVVLASEGDADSLAAVSAARISVRVVAPPIGYVARHEGPEISGITGFGDIGEAELGFSPSILLYSILPNGLVSASRLTKQTIGGEPQSSICGRHFMGTARSIDMPLGEGFSSAALELKPVSGFPRLGDSILPMAWFATSKPLPKKKVMIKSRVALIPDFQLPKNDHQEQRVFASAAKVVLHEIDLDGDGLTDILIWDTPSIGDMSGALNVHREWYLNIDGRWYSAGGMDEQECT